jgi:retinol-binding protein 3
MKIICAVVATLLFVCRVFAADPELTPAQRRQLGEIVPYLLDTLYVSPEKGKQLADTVRASFAGRYESAKTAAELADAINADLAPANDKHLRMSYSAADAASPILTVDDWKARIGGRPMMRVPNRDEVRLTNFGVAAAQVLDGNVGYLRITQFVDGDDARAAIAKAMAFLEHTDAMIVDVRTCPGGSAGTVAYLASFFFGPETIVLMNRWNRQTGQSMQSTTVDVDGRRRTEVGLYILTSARSGSACESFPFSLQQWGRAKTVGEQTAGAGNNNAIVPVGAGLRLSVSVGTAVHGKTGKPFEGTGVLPDIAAPADQALDVAHAEALRVLGRPKRAGSAMEMQRRDGTTSKRESRYTDAYARVGGRWQVVSSHQGTSH